MKPITKNIFLVIIAAVVALTGTEVGLRFFVGMRENHKELRSMLEWSRQVSPKSGVTNVSLRGLVQPSKNDRLVYELKPGLTANFVGVPVAINKAGFRERDMPIRKNKATFRIVGLGDSYMFGWGVPAEQTYLRVLENMLQERGDPVAYETLNFAVPGYNAAMEVEAYASIARRYEPDLVIMGLIGNDADVPNFMKQSALTVPSTIYIYNLLFHGVAVMKNRAWNLMPTRWDNALVRLEPVGDLPESFRDMVGVEAVRRSYAELARMTREAQIPVLVVGDYHMLFDPAQVAELEAHSRFVFVERDSGTAYERRHGVTITPKAIRLSPEDPHPNALGHAVVAEGIYQTLVDRRLIPPRRP